MPNMIYGLFSTIFANDGIYIAITFFVRLNMPIQHVLTFNIISFPLSFINFPTSKTQDSFSNL